jgi:hypothetical protein
MNARQEVEDFVFSGESLTNKLIFKFRRKGLSHPEMR